MSPTHPQFVAWHWLSLSTGIQNYSSRDMNKRYTSNSYDTKYSKEEVSSFVVLHDVQKMDLLLQFLDIPPRDSLGLFSVNEDTSRKQNKSEFAFVAICEVISQNACTKGTHNSQKRAQKPSWHQGSDKITLQTTMRRSLHQISLCVWSFGHGNTVLLTFFSKTKQKVQKVAKVPR